MSRVILFCLLVIAISALEEDCSGYADCYDICKNRDVKSCSITITSDGKEGVIKRITTCDGKQRDTSTSTDSKKKVKVECSYSNETTGDQDNYRTVSTQTKNSVVTFNE